MLRASLVLLATLAAARGAPTSGTEHGLALLDELEADVHALDAQLGRSTHDAKHRDAFGGLERRTIPQDIAANILTAFGTITDKMADEARMPTASLMTDVITHVLRSLFEDPKFNKNMPNMFEFRASAEYGVLRLYSE